MASEAVIHMFRARATACVSEAVARSMWKVKPIADDRSRFRQTGAFDPEETLRVLGPTSVVQWLLPFAIRHGIQSWGDEAVIGTPGGRPAAISGIDGTAVIQPDC